MIYRKFKRLMDISLSFVLIAFLFPLFILIPVVILFTMGRPVLFIQYRAGLNNRTFRIYKYRTMRISDEEFVTDQQRITKIGNILRMFRVDELPQLFNIIKGDMSFIGPRPLLPRYLPYYSSEEIKRHDVRPGLSGLSQVNNLNYPKWEDQFTSDLYYVNNVSFKLDIKIFFETLLKILRPASMKQTGIAGGRTNFDDYRKLKTDR
jgi:lipopolysaccharide/colanic/teichoic acid biosynthesis glycosyltransferase